MHFFRAGNEKEEEIAGEITCSQCNKKPAEIFQVTGDYCVECWQMLTHTNA
ncbi:MAG: hypothetical protein ABI347_06370 [Nitrososphaera sp.]|jgi:hypothetical protein